jgi:hypothetical protein
MSITVEFESDVEFGIQKYMLDNQVSREEAINALLQIGLAAESDNPTII